MNCGDEVKDSITGFRGIVTSRTVYLNGCVRLCVQSQKLEAGKSVEDYFDEQQLTLVKADAIVNPAIAATGGARPAPRGLANPR